MDGNLWNVILLSTEFTVYGYRVINQIPLFVQNYDFLRLAGRKSRVRHTVRTYNFNVWKNDYNIGQKTAIPVNTV